MNINALTRKCFLFWYIFILETDMNKNQCNNNRYLKYF